MSVSSLSQYYSLFNSFRTIVEDFKDVTESEVEKIKKYKNDYNDPLYIVSNDVKDVLNVFLKEIESYSFKIM